MERRSITTGLAYEEKVGYSRALVVGDWVFVSGTTGRDRLTNEIPEGIVEQMHNTFKTIIWALEEAGSAMAEVVRGRVAVTDRRYEEDLIAVLGHYLGPIRPALTIYVAELLDPRLKVEIDVTALRGSAGR